MRVWLHEWTEVELVSKGVMSLITEKKIKLVG